MDNYQDYEGWKQWERATFGSWSAIEAAYFSAELRRAGFESCQDLRIFEIGFGNGAFGGYVSSKGGNYSGSELNEALVGRAKEYGLHVVEGGIKQILATDKPASFDVVVAFDVLEHLDVAGVITFLLDARELLKSGGVVLARVPSGDSPFGRAIFHGDITHRTALGSSAIHQIASQADFDVIDVGPPRFPIVGIGRMRAIRRAGIRLAQILISCLINLVFHDGQPRVITANLVFVLRKPVARQ